MADSRTLSRARAVSSRSPAGRRPDPSRDNEIEGPVSGVLGIFHRDGRPVDPDDVARLSGASRARAVDGEALWIQGPAAIGHQSSRITPESTAERQPLVWADAVVSFDGRLDNRDELIR